MPPARPDLHVLVRFLDRMVAEPASWSRSRLQRAVGLNYDLFRKYLGILVQRGLIEEVAGPDGGFRITSEGIRVHGELARWLRDLFGGRV